MTSPLRTLGLYVHSPFCVHKCGYCDFNSWAEERLEPMHRWAVALERQLDFWTPRVSEASYRIDTVFWGGGTPSLLPNDVLVRVGRRLRQSFDFTPNFEWTVECNPETLDCDKLVALREMGATRLSIGLQSFRDANLERLERRARRKHNIRALELVAREWSGAWSGDLMFGLPDQRPEEWEEDLNLLLGFGPHHVSAYQLTLTTERARNWRQPAEDTLLRMFDQTAELCAASGLPRYEVSNFARPGQECRHNLRYWRLEPFLGLGPGAAGLLPPPLVEDFVKDPLSFGAHQKNPDAFEAWEASAGREQERLFLKKRSALEHAEELLLMGLRLPEGVDISRFGRAAQTLSQIPQNPAFRGLLELVNGSQPSDFKDSRLRVTDAGLRLLDTLLPKLYRVLENSQKLSGPNLDLGRFDTKFSGMAEFTENPADNNNPTSSEGTIPNEGPVAGDTLTSEMAHEAQLTEWKNKVTYLAAEIENMRKRYVREKSEIIKYANEDLIRMVLPILDNLMFAVKATKDSESTLETSILENPVVSNLFKGVDMTLKHFEATLEQIGVKPVMAEGQAFDPTQHEAVGQASDLAHKDNHVASVMQRGWTLGGRILRPARVIVNKLPVSGSSREQN